MRWLKHMTATRRDEKIATLLTRHGTDGYGTWWLLLESIAEKLDSGSTAAELTYPLEEWALVMRSSRNKVKVKLKWLGDLGLISTRSHIDLKVSQKDLITISIPNLLKYRDEYSRKSGHSPDTRRTMSHQSQSQKQKQKQSQSENTDQDFPVEEAAESLRMDRQTPSQKGKGQPPEPEDTGLQCVMRHIRGVPSEEPADKVALKLIMLGEQMGLNPFQIGAEIERARRKASKRAEWTPESAGWFFGVLKNYREEKNGAVN